MSQALSAATNALETINAAPDHDRAGPSAAAAHIEDSGTDPRSRDDLLACLQAARSRLQVLGAEPSRTPAFEAALGDLDREIRALGSSLPVVEQEPATARAFRALADAVFLAAGQDAPFAGQRRSTLVARSMDEHMEQLRSDASALANADSRSVRTRAAEAMLSLAELVSQLRGTTGGAGDAKEIIFQAERLRRRESAPFARSEWVGRGLLAALQTLESFETCHPERVDEWVEVARRAATDLPEHGTLFFQHARVQDAFRATVDAFGVALLDKSSCPKQANSASAAGTLRPGPKRAD